MYLLTMGHETEQLDYKQECDLNDQHALVEFAHDLAVLPAPIGGERRPAERCLSDRNVTEPTTGGPP